MVSMATIREVLRDRGDLSTFVVHLTRGADPRGNLESILTNSTIEARSCFGPQPSRALAEKYPDTPLERSQKAACFTETPLQFVRQMCGDIENRIKNFAPYGVAFTRTYARAKGVNPVWYVDRHHLPDDFRSWLIAPVWEMINSAAASGLPPEELAELSIFKLTPFIETMGRPKGGNRKEFWWEREWRKVGDLGFLPSKAVVVLAPAAEHEDLRGAVQDIPGYRNVRLVDASWAQGQIEETIDGLDNEPFPP